MSRRACDELIREHDAITAEGQRSGIKLTSNPLSSAEFFMPHPSPEAKRFVANVTRRGQHHGSNTLR